jgi:hypothetical protein
MIDISEAVEEKLLGDYSTAHLVEIRLSGGTLRYTENGYDLLWDGETWLANGLLLDLDEPKYTSELRINEITLALSGADQTTIAQFLATSQYNRRVIVWRAYLGDDGQPIDDPIRLGDWRISGWSFDDSTNSESIMAVKLSSEFADWEKTRGRRTTESSQQRFYPNDRGFEFASSVSKQQKWGGV